MDLHRFGHARELLRVADAMSIKASILPEDEGQAYIASVLEKFKPWKTEGHLAIGDGAKRMATETHESSFSNAMAAARAMIFFEQNDVNRHHVIVVDNAQDISRLIDNSHGMEYFVSDEEISYLISVNWYAIEYVGDIDLQPA